MLAEAVNGRRVLVVEDEYFIAQGLVDALERVGAEVIGPVASVEQALASLVLKPDIVILDVRLGGETSFPIADELARLGITFVFSTGTENAIPNAHRMRPVCLKPLTQAAVLKVLADALESRPN